MSPDNRNKVIARRLSQLYIAICVLTCNTLTAFVALNLALVGYAQVKPEILATPAPAADALPFYSVGTLIYGMDRLRQVYPGQTDDEIAWVTLESHNQVRYCQEGGIYAESPYSGRYLHVDPAGYRVIAEQAPFPPTEEDFVIFFYGGSTTFGYGDRDENTIPSFLQEQLRAQLGTDRIAVYNFGRGAFYSSLELELFRQMVEQGEKPDMAIFLDGLNDFYSLPLPVPDWTGICNETPESRQRISNTLRCKVDELCLPIQRYATHLQDNNAQAAAPQPFMEDASDNELNKFILERWFENKAEIERIAAENDIKVGFVMQPVPTFAYNLDYHLFAPEVRENPRLLRTTAGYELWNQRYTSAEAWTANTLNLSMIQQLSTQPLYIDRVHYTSGFNRAIAVEIATWLVSQPDFLAE